jgi:ABC-2 type transport system ATP-binding protein
MIKVDGLTKRYARTVAVDNISFEVEKGQIVGFLGPNGAGKTTTMRVLTCFMPPTGGTAHVAGFDIMQQPLEVKRRIGYLPETPPLYPEMEVVEYLNFVGRLKGIAKSNLKRRLGEVVDRCAIGDVRKKLVSKLSRGYRQRVGLAQAIIHNPDVLILDEPTAGLDPKQINETRRLIKELAGEHTIILSTHILPEVEQTCQQVVIIHRGRLVATDSVDSLTHRLRGSETVAVEVSSPNGEPGADVIRERLEQVSGVTKAMFRETRGDRHRFEVESVPGRSLRGDVARAVVEAGWDLHELHASALSLEEIFLQLTATEDATTGVTVQ